MSKIHEYKRALLLCKSLLNIIGPTLRTSKKYKLIELTEPARPGAACDVQFVQKDIMDTITRDVAENLNPLVIIPTGDQSCGEWDLGVHGWEESIAYRSTLSLCLTDDLYPIGRDEGVYCPTVYAFRGSNYETIKSFQFATASVVPMTRADFSVENDRDHFKESFEMMFKLALKYGHRSIIMNAFGCDRDNNPVEIAKLLGDIIGQYGLTRVTIVFQPGADPLITTFRKNLKHEN